MNNIESKRRPVGKKEKGRFSGFLLKKRLRHKECLGKMNEREFYTLLSLDFSEELKSNLPLKTGEVFSFKKELKSLKNLDTKNKGIRKEKLDEFKNKLERQRRALGMCRRFIERTIEFNPDTPKDKLMEVYKQFALRYGFDDENKKNFKRFLNVYLKTRENAFKTREKYKDDRELIKKSFGVSLSKEDMKGIDVSVGAMSIDILADEHITQVLYERSDLYKVLDGRNLKGFLHFSSEGNKTFFIVINKSDEDKLSSKKHENAHIKNYFSRKILRGEEDKKRKEEATKILVFIESGFDDDEKESLIKKYISLFKQDSLEELRDELVARLPELGKDPIETILNNKSYNLLLDLKDKRKGEDSWDRNISLALEEQERIFNSSFVSFDKLIKEGKYSKDEALAILTDKDLKDWPKTVDRHIEEMKKNKRV